jgi:hypothetical protein
MNTNSRSRINPTLRLSAAGALVPEENLPASLHSGSQPRRPIRPPTGLRTLAAAACCAAGLLGSACSLEAANLQTAASQGAGADWTAAIWQTNGAGALVGPPVAGNTYELIANASPYGNNGDTHVRGPQGGNAPVPAYTFPGDSLTLDTNTEFRFSTATTVANTPGTNIFPGVGGNAGLILKGGVLNTRAASTLAYVGGIIRVDAPSYLSYANNAGQAGAINANSLLNIYGQLNGANNLIIFGGDLTCTSRISCLTNTFSGQWFLKSGSLLGAVANSLGTNSITVDPNYTLPSSINSTYYSGPAMLEVNYDLNSAGVLTLINGGQMRLHQNCCFSAVNIEGTPLGAGTHFYSELAANFPNSFAAGGLGSITVQPYGTPPALTPQITSGPQPQMLLAGRAALFSVAATGQGTLSYHWRRGGVNLSDGGNISGSTTTNLTVSNVGSGDVGNYDVMVSNGAGPTTSAAAALTVLNPGTYEAAVLVANPMAFYLFNETGDPATNAMVFDSINQFNGTYGTGIQNGNAAYNVHGPMSADGFAGLGTGNKAALFTHGSGTSLVTVQPWNLNTNTVTIAAWINPAGSEDSFDGVVFCRGGDTAAGLNYTPNSDANGNYTLGYTWDNEHDTFSWDSRLVAPSGQWSFVALVVTPTNATIHVMNTNGLVSATHTYNHVLQRFGGTTLIGDDSNDGGTGARVFNGTIDDVVVFASALSKSQLATIFSAGSGAINYPPLIGAQPASQTLYAQQMARFTVLSGGTDPLAYRWEAGAPGSGVFTNVIDGGRISGSQTPTLSIATVQYGMDDADFIVIITNNYGAVTSRVASLSVQPVGVAEAITLSVQEASGEDWDTYGRWSDGNPASLSAIGRPGSTYEVQAGGLLRTPTNPNVATFPGDVLMISGNGVYTNSPPVGSVIGELRLKQPTPGAVIFKRLVMNGGQIDAADSGVCVIGGEIDFRTNTPIYNDSTTDGARSIQIDAQLTGSGTIEYHGYAAAFNSTFTSSLNVTGTSNTFTGEWNVVAGTLLGTGHNALGTGNILVNTNGTLETAYDVISSNAALVVIGRMYLHQNDTFQNVVIGGVGLTQGTYSFAQLNSAYPANFPASWLLQTGSTVFNGSGSITVLGGGPTIVNQPASQTLYEQQSAQFTVLAAGLTPLSYQWWKGTNNVYVKLADGGQIAGSTTPGLTVSNLLAANAADYLLTVSNAYGAATSSVATLTILPVGPPENITLSVLEALGEDWNTANRWSDGNPASRSAITKPGSTYEVLAGGRLRTPVDAATATFPGNQLTISGDGVWSENGTSSNIGELRLKPGVGGTVSFKQLVMNGGQLDIAQTALTGAGNGFLAGEVDVLTNTPIYSDNATTDLGVRIDAWLTGSGNIEYRGYYQAGFNPAFTNCLNIAGTSNTFSGKWNVVLGVLLGTAPGSLGTNDITVGNNGVLETTYNINNPKGSLFLDGQMYLHQNDRFTNVVIGGVALARGTYTFAQLNGAYPTNFPSTWKQPVGSAFSTGSGSISVGLPPPVTLQFHFSGSSLQLSWPQGTLLEATNVTGPWTTNAHASPLTITPNEARRFYRVLVQ